ncbi:farnesyl cysteine-carboxyl methyltransferase, variant 2 [Entomophthora muscae]|uniref:Farnesyl cysteine-carboxyl methyltransferase, variant 2 n=1 Tax=Entomophthora muscae TaxID=34485 RepID=A0ACC2RY29_9FUNG|nr:farnesyl cysteine-carboxyl methyltransferase, variant 2 [Entomophthora muscae]
MESNSNSEPQRQGTTGNDEYGASGKNPPISPGGTIKLTNSYERSPQSQERFKTFYRAWRSQWAQGDHIAPNIALYSVLAGMLIGSGLMGFFFTGHRAFGLYLFSLGIFHLFEYLTTAIFNPRRVKLDSFVYDPVTGYHHAIVASIFEYWFKQHYYSGLYSYVFPIQILGGLITLVGQWFRSQAMVEASTSFNHHVASMRDHDHTLVTAGIFR